MKDSLYLLLENYQSNDVLRTLIKLIPYGSMADNKLASFYTREKERRAKAFFDELAIGKMELTEEIIETDQFLHRYVITFRAVLETKRTEKIQYLARLLKNANSPLVNNPEDYYEDFLKVLDDLTFQEIIVLTKIRKEEKAMGQPLVLEHENTRRNLNKKFYRKLKAELAGHLEISEDEVLSIFIRLQRTGCVNLDKNIAQIGPSQDTIATTDFFRKLESLALFEPEK